MGINIGHHIGMTSVTYAAMREEVLSIIGSLQMGKMLAQILFYFSLPPFFIPVRATDSPKAKKKR